MVSTLEKPSSEKLVSSLCFFKMQLLCSYIEGLMNDIRSGVKLRKAADRPAHTPAGVDGGGGGAGGESSSVSEIMKRVANIRASMAGDDSSDSSDDDW
jgi:hypothetical protein